MSLLILKPTHEELAHPCIYVSEIFIYGVMPRYLNDMAWGFKLQDIVDTVT